MGNRSEAISLHILKTPIGCVTENPKTNCEGSTI